MAYVQSRQVTVGELITASFEQLAGIKRELAIYFGVFLIAGLIAETSVLLRGVTGIAAMIGYFVGQYWLYRSALQNAGVMVDPRFKVFSFFAMALVLIFPIVIGLNFLVIPGLMLAGKWVMAPTFLVAEDRNLFEAIGDSWRASENNLLPLTLTFTILCFIWFAITAVTAGVSNALLGRFAGEAFSWISLHILPVLLMGLSLAAYRALGNGEADLASVFE